MWVKGTFYLKNGVIIEESSPVEDGTSIEELNNEVEKVKEYLKTAMKMKDGDGCITFGDTIIRFSDISAIKLIGITASIL